jgi:hypothetical protein
MPIAEDTFNDKDFAFIVTVLAILKLGILCPDTKKLTFSSELLMLRYGCLILEIIIRS